MEVYRLEAWLSVTGTPLYGPAFSALAAVLTRRRADKETSDSIPSCLLVTMAWAARVVCVELEAGYTIWRLRR